MRRKFPPIKWHNKKRGSLSKTIEKMIADGYEDQIDDYIVGNADIVFHDEEVSMSSEADMFATGWAFAQRVFQKNQGALQVIEIPSMCIAIGVVGTVADVREVLKDIREGV